MNSVRKKILFALWLLLPLAQIDGLKGVQAFVLMHAMPLLCASFGIVNLVWFPQVGWRRTPVFIVIIIEVISYLLSLINLQDSPDLLFAGFRQLAYYASGWIFFTSIILLVASPTDVETYLRGMVLVGIVTGLLGLAQMTFLPHQDLVEGYEWLQRGDNPWQERNATSTLTNRNIYCAYLLLLISMSLVLSSCRKRKIALVSLLANIAVLTIIKGMAATCTAAIIVTTYFLLPVNPKQKMGLRILLFSVLFGAVLVMAFFEDSLIADVVARTPIKVIIDAYGQGNDESFENRRLSFYRALELFKVHPIIGNGLDVGRRFAYGENGEGWAESVYTLRLAETGLVGVVSLLLFQCLCLWRAWRLYQRGGSWFLRCLGRGLVACWLGFIAYGFFETAYMISPHVNIMLWGLLGVGEAGLQISAGARRQRMRKGEQLKSRAAPTIDRNHIVSGIKSTALLD